MDRRSFLGGAAFSLLCPYESVHAEVPTDLSDAEMAQLIVEYDFHVELHGGYHGEFRRYFYAGDLVSDDSHVIGRITSWQRHGTTIKNDYCGEWRTVGGHAALFRFEKSVHDCTITLNQYHKLRRAGNPRISGEIRFDISDPGVQLIMFKQRLLKTVHKPCHGEAPRFFVRKVERWKEVD